MFYSLIGLQYGFKIEPMIPNPAKFELHAVTRFLNNAKIVRPIVIHTHLCKVYGEACLDIKNV